MKFLTILSALLLSASVFAERSGTDERIHICIADKDASPNLGQGKFRVHIIAGKEMKITRLKDGKWLRLVDNGSGALVHGGVDGNGNLWPSDKRGYVYDVDKDGVLAVAYGVSEGSYELNRLQCKLVRTISALDPLSATEELLNQVAGQIELGNGDYDVSKFDLGKFSLSAERQALLKHRLKGCKWDNADGENSKSLVEVNKLLKTIYDGDKVVAAIKPLNSKAGLRAALALVSDNGESCSRARVWLFTSDGYKLELNIDGSD